MTNDIEKARAAREQRAFADGAEVARSMAKKLAEGLPGSLTPIEISIQTQAFMIAALAILDACGMSREQAIQLFTNLANGLSHPAGVFE